LNYADSVFAPAAQVSPAPGGFTLTLSNQLAAQDPTASFADIRYTLDGTQPSAQSPRYSAPLTLPPGTLVRAAAFAGTDEVSRTWEKHLDARAVLRRDSHDLEQCSDGIGLLLSPSGGEARPLAIDIMNPCWIDRRVDLSKGPLIVAAVAPLPFNYEIGADAAKIRVGDARTVQGELEVHVDGCDTPALVLLPIAASSDTPGVTTLPPQRLPALAGWHDLCLRFARPRLDPMWALDWVEIGG
jgi:hexosaminidase